MLLLDTKGYSYQSYGFSTSGLNYGLIKCYF